MPLNLDKDNLLKSIIDVMDEKGLCFRHIVKSCKL
jgi:hypothetical protein